LRDLLLGVRFVQADGVVTWGGAKVVKSVTGYDVPKLMVGSLGTLGILAELTLRLHPRPESERTWLVTFDTGTAAQDFAAAILDTSIQPYRIEFLNAGAITRAGGRAATAAIAVTLASVEQAVVEQGHRVSDIAIRHRGTMTVAADDWWTDYDRLLMSGRVALRVGVPPTHLAATAAAIESAFGGDSATVVTACVATGAFIVLPSDTAIPATAGAVDSLRSLVARLGGHVVIVRAPHSVRATIDPWGPIDPPVLRLMRAVKETFDPVGTLNPGRFAGGL
jgi:glycolate oxidase FAD binding subunit